MSSTGLDFRSNSLLFKDPEFDGDPTDVVTVPPDVPIPKPPIRPVVPDRPVVPEKNRRVARVSGVDVEIVGEIVQYLDDNGNLVQQNLGSCVRNNILGQYETLDNFRAAWLLTKSKGALARQLLLDMDWDESFETRYGYKVDPFDIVCCFAYEMDPPISRARRARLACVDRFIEQERFDGGSRELLHLLVDAYATSGFEALRNLDIFNMPQFRELGWTKLKAVKKLGGKDRYLALLNDLENVLYEED